MREPARGQSELIGFFLIFSVIIVTIALVGATGLVGLENAKDFQRTTNAEQGFVAFAADVDDVARRGAPARATTIGLADATLSAEQSTTITVRIDNGTTENVTVEPHSLVYESGSGTTIAYTAGALVRADEGSPVMFRRPSARLTNDTLILPIVLLSPTANDTVGGTTDVAVETRRAGTNTFVSNDVDTVSIEVTSPHADAWYRYLDEVGSCDTPEDGTVECQFAPDRLRLTIHRIDVSFT